jgi:hypothetical protein
MSFCNLYKNKMRLCTTNFKRDMCILSIQIIIHTIIISIWLYLLKLEIPDNIFDSKSKDINYILFLLVGILFIIMSITGIYSAIMEICQRRKSRNRYLYNNSFMSKKYPMNKFKECEYSDDDMV